MFAYKWVGSYKTLLGVWSFDCGNVCVFWNFPVSSYQSVTLTGCLLC